MPKQRCVIVWGGDGSCYLVNGSDTNSRQAEPYNLDNAYQNGARIVSGPHPFGPASAAFMLVIEEGEQKAS